MELAFSRCLSLPRAAGEGEQPLRSIGQDVLDDEQPQALTAFRPPFP